MTTTTPGADYEGRPMLIFCACHLPDPQTADYDVLLEYLDQFVENDYTVVLFSGGARFRPGWSWLFRAYNQLGRKYKKNLKRLYVVHPSIWVRLLMDMMKAVISPKFARKLTYVSTLSGLATEIPLRQIELPPAVYQYNLKYESSVTYPPARSIKQPCMFKRPLDEIMGEDGAHGYPLVVVECVEVLRKYGRWMSLNHEGIFRKSASSGDLKQLRAAFDNGKCDLVDLETQDSSTIAVLLKLFFHELPVPLFSTSTYEAIRQLPVSQELDVQIRYVQQTLLAPMPRTAFLLVRYVFGLLYQVAQNAHFNLMTSHNLAIVWAPNLV
ncbi:Rho GTPase activation protein, partial [Thamnocephalis sphaerospora]